MLSYPNVFQNQLKSHEKEQHSDLPALMSPTETSSLPEEGVRVIDESMLKLLPFILHIALCPAT